MRFRRSWLADVCRWRTPALAAPVDVLIEERACGDYADL
jgi:hypothetical protein